MDPLINIIRINTVSELQFYCIWIVASIYIFYSPKERKKEKWIVETSFVFFHYIYDFCKYEFIVGAAIL